MKNNFFKLPEAQQRLMLQQASVQKNLPVKAVEKDLWVTSILQILFSIPCSNYFVFKGGTSLSKVYGLINRFSEDIDMAIDRNLFGLDGDLTKKKVKELRKKSSVFVRDELFLQLKTAIENSELTSLCTVEPEPDGEGDATYPEPRTIFVRYKSLFLDEIDYLLPEVKIEIGARSLIEPTEEVFVQSMIEESFPTITTTIQNVKIRTAVAEKTFLEKSFLLHELFSKKNEVDAKRRSRHIYDLYMMTQKGFAYQAVKNDELWNTIHHHRATLTSLSGVDYTPDIRDRIQLVPPTESLKNWELDYKKMTETMIYGKVPAFSELIDCMRKLEMMFKNRK